MQVVGQAPDRAGADSSPQAENLFKDARQQDDVDLLARDVEEVSAQVAHDEIEDVGDADTDGQGPQRDIRFVRNHPVVDVHDEQRREEGEHVDQEGGDQHLGVEGPGVFEDAPEPVIMVRDRAVGRVFGVFETGFDIDDAAVIERGQCFGRQRSLAAT